MKKQSKTNPAEVRCHQESVGAAGATWIAGESFGKLPGLAVWMLENARRQGVSEWELLQDYPGLSAADLSAAWAYVEDHPAEIESAIHSNLVA